MAQRSIFNVTNAVLFSLLTVGALTPRADATPSGSCSALNELRIGQQIPTLIRPKTQNFSKVQPVLATGPTHSEVFVLFEVSKQPTKNTLTVFHRGRQILKESFPANSAARSLRDKEGVFRPFSLQSTHYSRRAGTEMKNIIVVDRNWILAHQAGQKGFNFESEECALLPKRLSDSVFQAVKNSGLKVIPLMDRDGLPVRTDDGKAALVWGYDTLIEVRVSKELKLPVTTLTSAQKNDSTILE